MSQQHPFLKQNVASTFGKPWFDFTLFKGQLMIFGAMSNFAMGTILGKGFAQAQVHTNHSMSAEGTSAVMNLRVVVQNPFPRLTPWQSCIL